MRIKDCAADVRVLASTASKKILNEANTFIQIGTPIKNEYIHYEVLAEKKRIRVVLHIEDCYDKNCSYPYLDLLQFLKEQSAENHDIEWVEWNRPDRECRLKREMNTPDEICEGLKRIFEIFDPLIEKFEANQKPYDETWEYSQLEDSNESEEVCLLSAGITDLFNCHLTIPDYQRIYCWDSKRITDLWNNLLEMPDSKYHLGTIILHHKFDNDDKNCKYDIIDGQQRLVTLTLMLRALGYESHMPLLKAKFESSEACANVANSKYVINQLKVQCDDVKKLKAKIIKNLIFSVLVLNSSNLDLAYTFFSNQNSRGVALSDYDILKAHHLRYLIIPEQAEHLAQKWDYLSQEFENEDTTLLEQTLGQHLFRLRKWMRKHSCDEIVDRPVKGEFSAAPTMISIPPFGERFYFNEKIQGGSHFFAFTEIFVEHYRRFIKLPHTKLLRKYLMWRSHWKYESVIETLLFGYYVKFGCQYLSEVLYCIAGVIAQHRYNNKQARQYKINEHAQNSELIMMIDQASSPTFVIAESLPLIIHSGHRQEYIAGDFYRQLCKVFQAVLALGNGEQDFSEEDKRLLFVADNNVKQMIEKEYGK